MRKCANKGCLDEMNAAFLTEKAIETIKTYPALSLSHDAYCYNADAVNRLKEMGYEVVALQCRYKDYPTLPEEPEAGEYETEDEYKEAKVEYEQDMNDYMEEGKELVRRAEAGEISLFARIGNEDIVNCYVENSMMNAVSGQQAGQEQLSPIENWTSRTSETRRLPGKRLWKIPRNRFWKWI